MLESESEPQNEQEIIQKFNRLRQEVSSIMGKLNDLEADTAERDTVIKTLEPMEPSRKAFRLVHDVLVERTVGEVLPAIRKEKDRLEAVTQTFQKGYEQKKQELTDFQKKYKIKVKSSYDDEEEGSA
jgi:prefoldin subunit 2